MYYEHILFLGVFCFFTNLTVQFNVAITSLTTRSQRQHSFFTETPCLGSPSIQLSAANFFFIAKMLIKSRSLDYWVMYLKAARLPPPVLSTLDYSVRDRRCSSDVRVLFLWGVGRCVRQLCIWMLVTCRSEVICRICGVWGVGLCLFSWNLLFDFFIIIRRVKVGGDVWSLRLFLFGVENYLDGVLFIRECARAEYKNSCIDNDNGQHPPCRLRNTARR